jgi:hypothetical protein
MRKECKTLHVKAVDSLVVAVDHFNRAWDRGRTEAVLILLDRAFELLLKAIIVHRAGGNAIREKKKEGMTIGFDLCLRKCLSDADLKCLNEDEVVALQSLARCCPALHGRAFGGTPLRLRPGCVDAFREAHAGGA